MNNEKWLIDANELLRFLENEIDKYEGSLNKWERDYVKAVRVAAKIIRCFPTVDAVELVHGRWNMDEEMYAWKCSVCRSISLNGRRYSYCHNCGANMRGD